jgi:glycosyltransferase involved in cell wall biosynthesis
MINLFYSEGYWGHSATMNGPKKVVTNLLESLQQENIEYSINEEKYKYNFLIQYDYTGHQKHSELELQHCVIGPQVWFFDEHVQFLKNHLNYFKCFIVPSQWVKNLAIEKFGFPENKIQVWPVGVNLSKLNRNVKYDCLVYTKRRSNEELSQVLNFLENRNLNYNIISYGNYSESDLELLSSQSRFCFLLNGTESQGIAVQEIMSGNTPMFVWDVTHWNDQGPEWVVPASSVPYWSEECGEKFYTNCEMGETFDKFYSRIGEYNPRNFVENNLSYKKSVDKLLEIFDVN